MNEKSVDKQTRPTVHPPSRFDSGDGQGTSQGAPKGEEFLEHPILDGASEGAEIEQDVENPWRGLEDPALERHPERRARPDGSADPDDSADPDGSAGSGDADKA